MLLSLSFDEIHSHIVYFYVVGIDYNTLWSPLDSYFFEVKDFGL